MKSWMRLSMATLLLAALAVPTIAQESDKAARTFNLKEKFAKDQKVTETKEENNNTDVALEDGTVLESNSETETGTKVMEVLAVSEDGKITQARVRWTKGTTITEVTKLGQEPTDPVEMDSELKGASILYTFNAETKKWESKLEKGDAELKDVKKQLNKSDPFANAFIPNREVKLGESWEIDGDALKAMFSGDDSIELKEGSGTCKAEEVVKEGEVELLRVSFETKLKGKLKDENIGEPEITAGNKGSYFWDIKEGRIVRVNMENTGEFNATVQHPQAGALKLTVTIKGEAEMKQAYGKIGDKEEEEKEEEGGMDG